jgi:hypothetical protein
MLCRVDLVRTDVSEELGASFIRVTRVFQINSRAIDKVIKHNNSIDTPTSQTVNTKTLAP